MMGGGGGGGGAWLINIGILDEISNDLAWWLMRTVWLNLGMHNLVLKITNAVSIMAMGPDMFNSPPGQNGRHFSDDIFRCIFVNEKFRILIKISLTFVPKAPIDNKPALV